MWIYDYYIPIGMFELAIGLIILAIIIYLLKSGKE